ncbi:MAG: peptidylprolyl isomerase [Nitrospinota bacterium]|nr:peptidylprolyl isomerase [Nitrospinota bacterium]
MISVAMRFVLIVVLAFVIPTLLWAGDITEFRINGKLIPNIVDMVNGTKITGEFLRNEVETWRKVSRQQNKPITPKQEESFARNTLGQAIEQELLYQKGKKLNIKVETKTIQQEINNIQKKFPDYKVFLAALAFQHLSLEKLAEKIKKQLTGDEIIRREIAPHANVTDSEVKTYYNQHKDSFIEPKKYKISHIYISKVNTENRRKMEDPQLQKKVDRMTAIINKEARDNIALAFQQLSDGADFTEMVRKYSEDESTKLNGGEIGEVHLHQIDPIFAAVVSRLKVGATSEIVKHPEGLHIFKLIQVKPERQVPLEEMETDILNILLKKEVEKKKQEYISKLEKTANIEIFL